MFITIVFLVWLLLTLFLLVGIARKLFRIEQIMKEILAILQLLDVQNDVKKLIVQLKKAVGDYFDKELEKI